MGRNGKGTSPHGNGRKQRTGTQRENPAKKKKVTCTSSRVTRSSVDRTNPRLKLRSTQQITQSSTNDTSKVGMEKRSPRKTLHKNSEPSTVMVNQPNENKDSNKKVQATKRAAKTPTKTTVLPQGNSDYTTSQSGLIGAMKESEDSDIESLNPGDVIEFTDPIFGGGDRRFLREGVIISTDPARKYRVDMDVIGCLPDYSTVRRIKKLNSDGELVAHEGRERFLSEYKMERRELSKEEAAEAQQKRSRFVRHKFEFAKTQAIELARKACQINYPNYAR
jgi:hypothetical protein